MLCESKGIELLKSAEAIDPYAIENEKVNLITVHKQWQKSTWSVEQTIGGMFTSNKYLQFLEEEQIVKGTKDGDQEQPTVPQNSYLDDEILEIRGKLSKIEEKDFKGKVQILTEHYDRLDEESFNYVRYQAFLKGYMKLRLNQQEQ
jgi:hypothetical protein